MSATFDAFADLLRPSGEIRHASPAVRHARSLAPQGFSPLSPFSPTGDGENANEDRASLEALAADIAAEVGASPEWCLSLLDEGDM